MPMSFPILRRMTARLLAAVVVGAMVQAPAAAQPGDPPLRAGRVAELVGQAHVFDTGQGQWTPALRNQALAEGDRVSTAGDARATLQVGSLRIGLGPRSEIELVRLDDDGVQLQLHAGSAALRVRSQDSAGEVELATREARFRPLRAGLYRIDRLDEATWAATVRGDLMLEVPNSMPIGPGTRIELWRSGATGVLQQRPAPWPQDEFQQALLRDDARDERSAALRYASPEMTGVDELEFHGRWERHPEYGTVWAPLSVGVGWAPFRDGRWVWLRHWGWTWVDAQPWGFATSHYGRWIPIGSRWVWSPGAYAVHPVFAPALVAWVGGPTVSIGISIGGGPRPLPGSIWVPVAPHQTWRPWYPATPRYVDRVNHGPWVHRPPPPVARDPHPRERPRLPADPGLRAGPPPVQTGPGQPLPEPPRMRHTPRGDTDRQPGHIAPPALGTPGVPVNPPARPPGLPPRGGEQPGVGERPRPAPPAEVPRRPPAPVTPPPSLPAAPIQAHTPTAPARAGGPPVRQPDAPEERRQRSPESRQEQRSDREHLR